MRLARRLYILRGVPSHGVTDHRAGKLQLPCYGKSSLARPPRKRSPEIKGNPSRVLETFGYSVSLTITRAEGCFRRLRLYASIAHHAQVFMLEDMAANQAPLRQPIQETPVAGIEVPRVAVEFPCSSVLAPLSDINGPDRSYRTRCSPPRSELQPVSQ